MPKRVSHETHIKQKKKYYKKHYRSNNRCNRYKDWEIALILDHNIPDVEIAEKLGRSLGAIQQTRNRMKTKGA